MQALHEQEPTRTVVLPVQETPLSEEIVVREQTPPKTTRKRIVSKSRYALIVGIKAVFTSASATILLAGILSLMVACLCVLALFLPQTAKLDPYLWTLLLMTAGGGGYCVHAGRRMMRAVKQVGSGVVPLTRANTADLPAPDSLVRASSEPQQAQQAVLLRAAAEGVATPPEQLVRASVRQE